MTRFPVVAMKDSRVSSLPRSCGTANWTDDLQFLDAAAALDLVALAQVFCPHDWLDLVPYQTVVLQLDREAAAQPLVQSLITKGLDILQIDDRRFGECHDSVLRLQRVSGVQDDPFVKWALSRTIRWLYDDPVVWGGCGYEGVAGCHHDSPRDGFNDLDWLPEPELDCAAKVLP